MINKQNLWFITLFSLILILGIYYLAIDDDDLKVFSNALSTETSVEVEEDSLLALRVAEEENILSQIENCQNTILDSTATLEEKNSAYENLQVLSEKKNKSEEIEKLIKEKFNLQSFTKFNKDQINITISSKTHSNEIANNIIRTVQALYEQQMYITVKFE